MQLYKREGGDLRNRVTCGVPKEAPAEAAEAVEDVDGKPEKSGVSSRTRTEKIVLWQVPTTRGKGAKNIGYIKEEKELVGCGVCLRPKAWPWRHVEEGVC